MSAHIREAFLENPVLILRIPGPFSKKYLSPIFMFSLFPTGLTLLQKNCRKRFPQGKKQKEASA